MAAVVVVVIVIVVVIGRLWLWWWCWYWCCCCKGNAMLLCKPELPPGAVTRCTANVLQSCKLRQVQLCGCAWLGVTVHVVWLPRKPLGLVAEWVLKQIPLLARVGLVDVEPR